MAYQIFAEVVNNHLHISEEDIFHLTKVLRIRPHEVVKVVTIEQLFEIQIITHQPFTFNVISENLLPPEKGPEVTLLYALPKGDKLELVVQKAVELGVNHIVLVDSAHTVTKFDPKKVANKLERLNKIIKAAAMQSNRLALPTISGPTPFNKVIAEDYDLKLLAHEKGTLTFSISLTKFGESKHVAILVGPEGGFSDEEVKAARAHNFHIISFGSTILRSETAAIYALSILNHYKEGLLLWKFLIYSF